MTSQGQVEKRLQIIRIAISITDEGTINLQRLKLKKHKNNKQLDNILSVLDDENYAQASKLIDRYLHNTTDKPKATKPIDSQKAKLDIEEEALIKKFGLFTEPGRKSNGQLYSDAVMNSEDNNTDTKSIDIDDDEIYIEEIVVKDISKAPLTTAENIIAQYNSIERDRLPEKKLQKDNMNEVDNEIGPDESAYEGIEVLEQVIVEEQPAEKESIEYDSISYIDQKVKNMLNQYPQVVENPHKFESEEDLLYKISLNGYTEEDIEETISTVYALTDDDKLDEASHLLLIAAATESLYAQFILARELFKGKILQRDLTEAFTQINQLASDNYPEAVCDLAQFYEYGIGIGKDKKKAFRLYEDALDLGVKRADIHLTRMEDESKGILGRLFNKK